MAVRYVMSDPGHRVRQDRQRDRIHRVAEYLAHSAPAGLDAVLRPLWDEAPDDAARMRVIVDQVALYTESRLERIDRASAGIQAAWG
jgi:dGTPase